jgi:hypothetical protein
MKTVEIGNKTLGKSHYENRYDDHKTEEVCSYYFVYDKNECCDWSKTSWNLKNPLNFETSRCLSTDFAFRYNTRLIEMRNGNKAAVTNLPSQIEYIGRLENDCQHSQNIFTINLTAKSHWYDEQIA